MSALPLALVTGAAGGIGSATVRRFLKGGFRVAAVDRDAGRLREMFGEKVIPLEVDLDSTEAIHQACATILETHGAPRTVVNNAAAWYYTDSTVAAPEEWRHTLSVNVVAPAALAWELIPAMLGVPGASIVNISSRNAFSSSPRSAAYDASKAALVALTRTLAVEFGPRGLRVNAVCPGVVDTAANSREMADPEWVANYLRLIPLDRFAKAEDIANAIFFLASDEASFITGHTLMVDGGQISGQNFGRIFDKKNS